MKTILQLLFIFLTQLNLYGLDQQKFYTILNEKIPEWMQSQIDNDLSPFITGLEKKTLDTIFERNNQLCLTRIIISSNNIDIIYGNGSEEHPTTKQFVNGFLKLNELVTLPDADLIFSGHDTLSIHSGWFSFKDCPILVETKPKDNPGGILIPDRWALQDYSIFKKSIQEGNINHGDWNNKLNKLLFRGTDKGSGAIPSLWLKSPRILLTTLSNKCPEKIDAKFVKLQFKCMQQIALDKNFLGEFIPIENIGHYKYIMDIDGNCASPLRSALSLFSNSTVFKQNSSSILWWYNALIPNTHYIPVENDLSDLIMKIDWAINNDPCCATIAKNAMDLADQILNEETALAYLYRLLQSYSKKQKDSYNHI